ncbi:MAG: hypothetical protein ABW156_05030 [Jiangellaceae bacterium]
MSYLHELRTLHFDLAHLDPRANLTFRHSNEHFAVHRHTERSRREAIRALPWLRLIPERRLTHYAEVKVPQRHIVQTRLTVPKRIKHAGQVDLPVHMAIHVPRLGLQKARRRIMRRGAAPAIHPKLAFYGVTRERFLKLLGDDPVNIPEFPEHIEDFQDAMDAAVALLYHHTSLANLDASDGGSAPGIIVEECILPVVQKYPDVAYNIQDAGDGWMRAVPLDVPGSDTPTYSNQPIPSVMSASTHPLQQAIVQVQNNPDLTDSMWTYDYSVTSSDYDATVDAPPELVRAGAGGWSPRNLTPVSGLDVDLGSVSYTPPPASATWYGNNLWSSSDTPPLTPDHVIALLAGGTAIRVTTAAGTTKAPLAVGAADPQTGLTPLTGDFTGIATGKASCTVNALPGYPGTADQPLSGGTGFTYEVNVVLATASDEATVTLVDKNGNPMHDLIVTDVSAVGTLSVNLTNTWLRHLSVCVQYLDAGGRQLPVQGWSDRVPDWLHDPFEQDSSTPFVTLLSPVTTVFGVPVPNKPTTVTVPVWDEVHTVRFLAGGLGQGQYDTNVCPIGIAVTSLAELAMPPFMLAAGVAITNSATFKSLFADKEVLFAVCAAGGFLVAGTTATYIGTAQNPAAATEQLAEKFGPMMLSPVTSLGLWVLKQIAAGAAEKAVPFVDIGLMIVNAAVTTAQLSQTIVEVLDSPFFYETDVTRTMAVNVTLTHDPEFDFFPPYHDHFIVQVVHDVPTTVPTVTQPLDQQLTYSDPIKVGFSEVPAGGSVKVVVTFYGPDGWQSGQGETGWIKATPDNGVLDVGVVVTNNIIPLGVDSVYRYNSKITMVKGKLDWNPDKTAPPSATITTPSPYGPGLELMSWSGLTVAEKPGMAGFAYQATGLSLPPDHAGNPVSKSAMWTVRSVSIGGHPQDGVAYPAVGLTAKPGIAFDMASPDDGTGNNFFIEASNGEFDPDTNSRGGYHLRRLQLTATGAPTFTTGGASQSWGRFPMAMDRYVYHPQGYVFGLKFAAHKLFRVKVTAPTTTSTDATAPMATMLTGQGTRYGMLYGPVAMAAALDGRVLVLESLNRRVQAFDICGKPVPYFKNPGYDPADPDSPPTIPTLQLVNRGGCVYLDMAVEAAGYLYVLSYIGDGSKVSNYNVDLYEPDGTFLVTTPNANFANLSVDILRTMYTTNYEVILDGSNRPLPSIGEWLPPEPPATVTKS